ncbi:MAG TPA: class I SAM-dependent methyltransferase [Mycobacteriales bacterium]|nr:class I SAM-dependent methyltransferase [Mycobacteriales bacterium]
MIVDPRKCMLCGSHERTVLHRLDCGTVLRCNRCTLVSLHENRTGELVRCSYDEAYYSRRAFGRAVGYEDYFGSEEPERREIAAVFADMILRTVPGVRTSLDVGCGGGYLVDALMSRGVITMGTDTSGYVIERARIRSRATFHRGSAADHEVRRRGPFDVVTMMDVVEHLTDPTAVIRAAIAAVRPGGALLLLTPRFGGPLYVKEGGAWVHFNRDHVHYFTERTLRAVIAEACDDSPVTISEVLPYVRAVVPRLPASFIRKYTVDRDSIIAFVARSRAHQT